MKTSMTFYLGAVLAAFALVSLGGISPALAGRDQRCRARADFDVDGDPGAGECSVKWREGDDRERADIECIAPDGSTVGGVGLEGEMFRAVNADEGDEELVRCVFNDIGTELECDARAEERGPGANNHEDPTGDTIVVERVTMNPSPIMLMMETCEED